VVGAGRDDDTLGDLERKLQALEADVHRRAEKSSLLEIHVRVHMELLAFLESLEVPEALVGHVGPELAKP